MPREYLRRSVSVTQSVSHTLSLADIEVRLEVWPKNSVRGRQWDKETSPADTDVRPEVWPYNHHWTSPKLNIKSPLANMQAEIHWSSTNLLNILIMTQLINIISVVYLVNSCCSASNQNWVSEMVICRTLIWLLSLQNGYWYLILLCKIAKISATQKAAEFCRFHSAIMEVQT